MLEEGREAYTAGPREDAGRASTTKAQIADADAPWITTTRQG